MLWRVKEQAVIALQPTMGDLTHNKSNINPANGSILFAGG